MRQAAHSDVSGLKQEVLRQAIPADIPGMHRVRMAVTENRLASSVITEADYLPAIEKTGRGWVTEVDGQVAAFAVGNKTNGNILNVRQPTMQARLGDSKPLPSAT